jgi:transposase InsO family protein
MVVCNQQESYMECFRVYVCGIRAATCARDLARQSVNAPPLPVSKPVEARQRGTAGIEPSLGSKGDSYDNAMAETINGLCKAGLVHRRVPWKTVESLEPATLEWVTWFNHQRLLEFIGSIPPAEAEQRYHLQLAKQAEPVRT